MKFRERFILYLCAFFLLMAQTWALSHHAEHGFSPHSNSQHEGHTSLPGKPDEACSLCDFASHSLKLIFWLPVALLLLAPQRVLNTHSQFCVFATRRLRLISLRAPPLPLLTP
jgi:hypothetical protein